VRFVLNEAAEIEAAGGKAVANHGNVTLAEDADSMVATAVQTFGRLDFSSITQVFCGINPSRR
jgi:NAD(P)-dependent dehydrogenase (short-subunit alcohol dehydrogenase family)